ncbi:thioredoxin domain-containing protein [Desulfogranum japonicum]|uniref:hypothetical protein n=1 Tax=Desulfogranum japonicum TaxID=231447 RepID=UPI0003F6E3EA|nr:hypothetical protein [Desulfogranum japonicum]
MRNHSPNYRKSLYYVFLLVIASSVPFFSLAQAGQLTWQTSKQAAMSLAAQQGKLVLLLAGRSACSYTTYMQYTVCELTSPPILSTIEQNYIPWYDDVDTSDEWRTYASGLGTFYLPLICVIDPADSDNYLDRSTGIQDINAFYARLQSHIQEEEPTSPEDDSTNEQAIIPAIPLLLL